jgi:uncharacterized protein YlzI (FlbEa/FlbD family)
MDEPVKRGIVMIEVTKLNGTPMMLNGDLIKTVEASPDTMLTLIHGEKLIVRESIGEVVERVLAYRARLLKEVARTMHRAGDLGRIVALTSLDLPGTSTGSELERSPNPAIDR